VTLRSREALVDASTAGSGRRPQNGLPRFGPREAADRASGRVTGSPATAAAILQRRIDLDSSTVAADQVVASGAAIKSGALVSTSDPGSGALPAGTVFTVIRNTAATLISGTFSNLADGSSFTLGSNTFQADYEGGDGNHLTLTVVP
jgi:hypothetical protein